VNDGFLTIFSSDTCKSVANVFSQLLPWLGFLRYPGEFGRYIIRLMDPRKQSTGVDAKAYLQRINYYGSLSPNSHTLRELQKAHLISVPFENLSIHSGEPIVLEDGALFEKVVSRRRGGFCYELNGLFAALLRELGFDVAMLSAEVATAEGVYGPKFDHMTLLVTLEERWLVDVGFGDSFREPLLLDQQGEQAQGERSYCIAAEDGQMVVAQRINAGAGEWQPQYRFTLQTYQFPDYSEMCRYHQTSAESHFTRDRICSRATTDGRLTLSDMRFIESKTNGERHERLLVDEGEYTRILSDHFGIVMTKPSTDSADSTDKKKQEPGAVGRSTKQEQ
jgi:N-hydroxyarylamine O-acetyltransferase